MPPTDWGLTVPGSNSSYTRPAHGPQQATEARSRLRIDGVGDSFATMVSRVALRLAEPDDIDALVSIDDDASALYEQHGLDFECQADSAFAQAKRNRWLRAAHLRRVFLAVDTDGRAIAFGALDVLDGNLYLEQLSVRCGAMRRGIGTLLLTHSIECARRAGMSLWLTTYNHLIWNRLYYERHGFVVVPESECGAGIRHHLEEQRRFLPAPAERVAMRRAL